MKKYIDPQTKTDEILIPQTKVIEMTSLSASSLARMEDRGQFPKRRRLSQFRVAWVKSEILSWCEERINESAVA